MNSLYESGNPMIRVLFCGKDKFTYHRTRVLLNGIEKSEGITAGILRLGARNSHFAAKLREMSSQYDFVFVPAFRHKDVPWIKKHSSAPVVFDPLISEYLTKVIDYGQWYKAPTKYLLDWRAIHAADFLVADTEAMRQYYHRLYHYPLSRISVLRVGYISDDFAPVENELKDGVFHAGFYGSFVPLQGTDVIAGAASILKKENIVFDIIGDGATYDSFLSEIKNQNLNNMRLQGWLPYNQLSAAIAQFDVALGIFGNSGKAARVIPNKLYHYGAMKKCIITRDTAAVREIYRPDTQIVAIDPRPEKLAEAILELKENPVKAGRIAQAGFDLISSSFNECRIIDPLTLFLSEKKARQ